MDEPQKRPPTAAELREATIWRVVRAAYLRVIADSIGRAPEEIAPSVQNGYLDKWHHAMDRDVMMLREVMDQARVEGIAESQHTFHATAVREYDSHELLDEAIEYARPQPREEPPMMELPRHVAPKK